jgi:hypothetical protein
MSRPITTKTELPGTAVGPDCITLAEAAKYLICSQSTLMNWITYKKFTEADGLRRVGGLSRVYFPTLKARFADGTLMKNGNGQKKAGIPTAKPRAATKRRNRLELYEALRANGTDSTPLELPDERD